MAFVPAVTEPRRTGRRAVQAVCVQRSGHRGASDARGGGDRPPSDVRILFEDSALVAVSKPGGLLMHRNLKLTRGVEEPYLVDKVRKLTAQEVFPVHRLDRATSGVVLFAKSSALVHRLQDALRGEQCEKSYVAMVRGFTAAARWRNDNALTDQDSRNRVRRSATTDFERLLELPSSRLTVLRALPRTGRQNQIRRHLSSDRNHIIGDVKFGKGRDNAFMRERYGLPRLFLHARRLRLVHPESEQLMSFECPLPDDLFRFLCALPDYSSLLHNQIADTGRPNVH